MIVNVYPYTEDTVVVTEDDGTQYEDRWYPFDVSRVKDGRWSRELEGGYYLNIYNYKPNKIKPLFSEPISSYLISKTLKHKTPYRYYKDGFVLQDLKILFFDIETLSSGLFPDPSKDPIVIIAVGVAYKGKLSIKLIYGENEEKLLKKFIGFVREQKPHIISGHNIYGFDIPYLRERCKRYNMELNFSNYPTRYTNRQRRFAERTMDLTVMHVPGAEVLDTLLMAIDWDTYFRRLDGYGLKEVARVLGVAPKDRVYVEGDNITELWYKDRKRLLKYARHDIVETAGIFKTLSSPYLYLSRVLPLSPQQITLYGNGTKINLLIGEKYLLKNRGWECEDPDTYKRQKWGGFTKSYSFGRIENVHHADVASLYPSIMLTYKVNPEKDVLGVFNDTLRELTTLRLKKKKQTKEEKDVLVKERLDGEQSAYKILINSFYGWLGFKYAWFRDVDKADFVASTGQWILHRIMRHIVENNGHLVEVDTDGVLFTYEGDVSALVQSVPLPEGIILEYEGMYESVLAYKSKNYATLSSDGTVKIKGVSLKSRRYEPIVRDFMYKLMVGILKGDSEYCHQSYLDIVKRIKNRELSPDEIASSVSIKEDIWKRKEKVAQNDTIRTLPQYEVARYINEKYKIDVNIGDKIKYYIRENGEKAYKVRSIDCAAPIEEFQNDHHVDWYMKNRIKKIVDKFKVFFVEPEQIFSEDGSGKSEIVSIFPTEYEFDEKLVKDKPPFLLQ